MEKLNNIIEKTSPRAFSFLTLMFLCLESFVMNLYVCFLCIYRYLTTFSVLDLSFHKCNSIIYEEIENQHSPTVSNIGVWACMFYCLNIFFVIIMSLTIPLLYYSFAWIFLWSVIFIIKQKITYFLTKNKSE
jgi:hypothetical protein